MQLPCYFLKSGNYHHTTQHYLFVTLLWLYCDFTVTLLCLLLVTSILLCRRRYESGEALDLPRKASQHRKRPLFSNSWRSAKLVDFHCCKTIFVVAVFEPRFSSSAATRCTTLQYCATNCNALQHTATHCNAPHHTASHCIALQRTAMHCIALHRTASHCIALHRTASHCHALQYTAKHCIALQLNATHCNTVQHVMTGFFVPYFFFASSCDVARHSLSSWKVNDSLRAWSVPHFFFASSCNVARHSLSSWNVDDSWRAWSVLCLSRDMTRL